MKLIRSIAILATLLAGCSERAAPPAPEQTTAAAPAVTLPNPASENCIQKGGTRRTEKISSGEFSVCLFEDNRQCEEWALLRGACPLGGVRITGYVTPQARYCAIRGGAYVVTRQETATTPEAGTCTLPGARTCDALALYEGRCP